MSRHNGLIARAIVAVLAVAGLASCIEDNTPWPTVKGVIAQFEVEGQRSVAIDPEARHITVELTEKADPRAVTVTKIVLGDEASAELHEGQTLDLSSPVEVVVTTYADYLWTISATQPIARHFVIEQQVGEAQFDIEARRAVASVPRGTDLAKIKVLELKLGPGEAADGITTVSPELVGEYFGSASERTVEVSYRGTSETWTLVVTPTEGTSLATVSPFAHKVYLVGYGQEGLENGFKYRLANDALAEWTALPDSTVTHDKGVFRAWIEGLEADTEYEVRAFSGESRTDSQKFVTETAVPLPAGGFEDWYSVEKSTLLGKVSLWNPWAKRDNPAEEKAGKFWDTGNPGVVTLGDSNSVPAGAGSGAGHADIVASPTNPTGIFAYLETKFVGISVIGKVAGGNIYLGRYFGTSGTNGMCDMGIPWQTRPTSLKGWYQYYPQKITDVGSLHSAQKEYWMGTTDSLNITVALWAMQPGDPYENAEYEGDVARGFVVNTNPAKFRDITADSPGLIAFGNFATSVGASAWTEFDIELDYRTYDPLPSNAVLIVIASPSKNSSYFTAARGSLLYLDELSLTY
jgi:hypothetical protein